MKTFLLSITIFVIVSPSWAQSNTFIFIPEDQEQTNHLKAYGVTFRALQKNIKVEWLLNYRGGSFLMPYHEDIARDCLLNDVYFERLSVNRVNSIRSYIEQQDINAAIMELEKAPKIAVYSPPHALPWDDAVTLALNYADVPYDILWDREVLIGDLYKYDWLHLHHEDFTGQYGKFWASYRNQAWYINQMRQMEELAADLGYDKVSELKKQVVLNIKEYVTKGGFLFAMCSGTDTYDIALAALDLDIVPSQFDGDGVDSEINKKLNFDETIAFVDFKVITNPNEYEYSDIDIPVEINRIDETIDYFTLYEFSAKWDPVPTMLTQNHVSSIKGFYGQTTAFRKEKIKSSIVILGETPGRNIVKYIHGILGKGTFTFYAGHDPEDYTHRVDDPPTDLDLHPNSPGYRLIFNNILFPAAKKEKRKT